MSLVHKNSPTALAHLSSRCRLLAEAAYPFRDCLIRLLMLLVLTSTLESFGLALIPTVLATLISEGSASQVPELFQPIIQAFSLDKLRLLTSAIVAAIFVLVQAMSMVTTGYSTMIINRMRDSWRSQIITRYLTAPLGYILAQQSGKLIENLVNQPIRAAKFMRFIVGMCSNIILTSVLLVLLIRASWQISLIISILYMVISMFATAPIKRYAQRHGTRENKAQHQLTHMASEAIGGLQQIRIFGLEQRWQNQFMSASHAQSKSVLYSALLAQAPSLFGSITLSALVLAVVSYCNRSIENNFSLVVLFIVVGQRLNSAFSGLISNYTNMRNLEPSFDLVMGLLKLPPQQEKGDKKYRPPLNSVDFVDVCFNYDGCRPLLENVSFTLKPGTLTAVVGPSGSGKSTLISLLCGLLSPSYGNILINGQPLNDYDPVSWLQRISIVSQDNFLFHGSILENLLVGKSTADLSSIIRALADAGASQFVDSLPEGTDTVVGERGATLSGGQVQRLAIARALLRDGDLMIFDEATSALDNLSQQQVLKTLRFLAQTGKIVLMISHRSEAVLQADYSIDLATHQSCKPSI